MTWVNEGLRRKDVVADVTVSQWVVIQPSGGRFNDADNNDTAVYLNGATVDALLAVYNDIQNAAMAADPPLNGRLGEYGSVDAAEDAPTAGPGALLPAVAVPRGHKMVVLNTVGKSVAEWDSRTGKTVAQGVSLGYNDDFDTAFNLIQQAYQTGGAVESTDGTRITIGSGSIVDATLATWTIEVTTGRVLRNGLWNSGATATQALYLGDVVYRASGGRWYSWSGSVWVDEGIADPENPTPSIDFFTVPDDGAYLIGDDGVTYERGAAAGSGYILLENGLDRGGWCDKIKIGDGAAPRTVYHSNPSGLGWIYRDGSTWSVPGPDPEGGGGGVTGGGVTTGSIAAGSNLLFVDDATDFDVDDWLILPAEQQPGNNGPGGSWPWIQYANAAARNAALGSRAILDNVLQLDTGNVYVKWHDGQWWLKTDTPGFGSFYDSKRIPLALIAQITEKVGTTLTLDKTAQVAYSGAVFFDIAPVVTAALAAASNGSGSGSLTTVNLNTLFPGWSEGAVGGPILAANKSYVKLTCDSRDSFRVFSPKGAPSAQVEWLTCTGCRETLFQKVGNWKASGGFGPGFEGSTGPNVTGFLSNGEGNYVGQMFPSGSGFFYCTDCEVQDQTVVDVPIRAVGGESNTNCWGRRVKNIQTEAHKQYVQYQMMWNDGVNCGTEDCEIDSYALLPGFELFRCQGGGHIRPKGKNAYISSNGSGGGWVITDANLRFTAGCLTPLENTPSWGQYAIGASCININRNGGYAWADGGGTITNAVIVQEGYLDSQSRNIIGMQGQDTLPNIRVNGLHVSYPAIRVVGIGAVGLQSYCPSGRYSNVTVIGQAINQATDYNIFVVNGINEGNLVCNVGGKSFNWTVS